MLSREQVLRQIRENVHHPATSRELLQILRVPRTERPTFRRLLKALVADGDLLQIRGNRFGLADRMDVVVGRLQMHQAGYGFVVPDAERDGGDLYIAPTNVKEALHGDRVVARVEHQRGDRSEGRIIRILERANTTIVGRYEIDDRSMGFVVPFDRRVLADVQVPSEERREAEAGDMVVVELMRWPTATRPPLGRVVEVLGPVDTPGVDTRIIIRKHSLPDTHGEDAIAEATTLGTSVRPGDLDGRTDFRSQPTVTIDGEHARDFDDAITLERLANGHYWLGVHIADVSHYVEEGSALDAEAYERGTSVYFPERAHSHVPGGAGDRPVLAQAARGPAGAVVPDGGHPQRRRGPSGVPRRGHQQQRADDLHRRQRDSHGPRPRDAYAIRAAASAVRVSCTSCSASSTAAGGGAGPWISICRKPKC